LIYVYGRWMSIRRRTRIKFEKISYYIKLNDLREHDGVSPARILYNIGFSRNDCELFSMWRRIEIRYIIVCGWWLQIFRNSSCVRVKGGGGGRTQYIIVTYILYGRGDDIACRPSEDTIPFGGDFCDIVIRSRSFTNMIRTLFGQHPFFVEPSRGRSYTSFWPRGVSSLCCSVYDRPSVSSTTSWRFTYS